MGFYDMQCSVTGVSLKGADAALVLLEKTGKTYRPMALGLHGNYNRFGTIDNLRKKDPNNKLVRNWLRAQQESGAVVIDKSETEDKDTGDLEDLLMIIERNVTIDEDVLLYRGKRVYFTLICQKVWDALVAAAALPVKQAEASFAKLFGDVAAAQEIYGKTHDAVKEAIVALAAVDAFVTAHDGWVLSCGGEQHFSEEMLAFLEEADQSAAGVTALEAGLAAYRVEVADLLKDEEADADDDEDDEDDDDDDDDEEEDEDAANDGD